VNSNPGLHLRALFNIIDTVTVLVEASEMTKRAVITLESSLWTPKATTKSSEALEESASEVGEKFRVAKFAEHNQVGIPTR
jgi:hypothetical protein